MSFNPPVSLTIGIDPYLNAINCPNPQGSNNDGIKNISVAAYILCARVLSNFILAETLSGYLYCKFLNVSSYQ